MNGTLHVSVHQIAFLKKASSFHLCSYGLWQVSRTGDSAQHTENTLSGFGFPNVLFALVRVFMRQHGGSDIANLL
jgi:hypothetical protein